MSALLPLLVDTNHSAEDSSGNIPSLQRFQEVVYRHVFLATNDVFIWDMRNFRSCMIELSNNALSSTTGFTVYQSEDAQNWIATPVELTDASASLLFPYMDDVFNVPNTLSNTYAVNATKRFMQLKMSVGAANHTAIIRLSQQPYISKADPLLRVKDRLTFISGTGGTTTTSPVILRTLNGGAHRTGIVYMQLTNAGTGGAEFTIEDNTAADGSGTATIIYRGYIGAGQHMEITPPMLIRNNTTQRSMVFRLISANGIITTNTLISGSGYTNGNYTNVPLTGGTGTGATADLTISGGAITNVVIKNGGSGYAANDTLSATSGIGAGTGFSVKVASVGYVQVYIYAQMTRINATA